MRRSKLNNKILLKIILLVILALSILQIKSLATNQEKIVVQENENQYIIYIDGMLDSSFEFSFSNSKDETNLNYINSAKDNSGNNIAYVDQELKNQYFNSETTYLWVKSNDETIINGEEISLNNVVTEEQLKSIENLTNKITVTAEPENEKIAINGEEGQTYYYRIISPSSNESYNNLINLIDEVNNSDSLSTYEKIVKYKELYDLYNELLAQVENQEWLEAENQEITKPYEAKEDQQYILWLKDSNGNVDIQILTAYEEEITNVEEEKETTVVGNDNEEETKENEEATITSSLPVTYDNMTNLVIALCIVLAAIVLIIAIKVINNKKTSKRS